MDTNIIVIGGESDAEMTRMTLIDKHIVASSGKARPNVLYISTANGDDRTKISNFLSESKRRRLIIFEFSEFLPDFIKWWKESFSLFQ